MRLRRGLIPLAATLVLAASAGPAYGTPGGDRGGRDAIRSITPITTVYTYGQKVSAVAVEYGATVNPRTLDNGTFGVADTIYNFRFNPIEDLPKLADRTVTRTYTNNAPTPPCRPPLDARAVRHRRAGPGRPRRLDGDRLQVPRPSSAR